MSTLPIVFGRNRTRRFTAILCGIPISMLLFIIINYLQENKFMSLYLVLFSLVPILHVALKLLYATSTKDFHKLNVILKIIMFFGVSGLAFLSINF